MYIPNCRKRFKPTFSVRSRKNEINAYWEGYLNEADTNYLKGYDAAVEDSLSTFFSNVSDFDFLHEVFVEGDIRQLAKEPSVYDLDEKLPDDAPKAVCFMRGLYEALVNWFESERDELIVSMIDGMEEEEYLAIRKEKDEDLPFNIRDLEYNQL